MSVIDTLITDRTQADVDRAEALAVKGWARMTAAEREQYITTKGLYRATDMNRVGEAVMSIATHLIQYGYSVTVSPKNLFKIF